MHTLLDIAKLKNTDRAVGLIEESLSSAPELQFIPARTVNGTSYATGIRSGLPATGFRGANEGITRGKSTFKRGTIECFILGGQVAVDKAVAMADEDGQAAYEMREADGVMKSSLLTLGSQIFEGTAAGAKGFPGLRAFTPFGTNTINAGGTTAGTSTSIYLVKFGPKDVQLVFGRDTVIELGDFRDETIYDANNKPLAGRVADLCGWAGLQIGSINSVVRICNVTTDATKGATDLLLSQALELFPAGYMPDMIFMARRSRGQLQRSRPVTNIGNASGGSATIAPLPTSFEGIPIVATDSIPVNGAIES